MTPSDRMEMADAKAAARAQLSLERRRKRNREAMQRLRERQQRAVEQLRLTAEELATTHATLLQELEKRQLSVVLSNELAWPLPTLQLQDARQEAQSLVEANASLQQAIDERIRWEDHVALLLQYLHIDTRQPEESPMSVPFGVFDLISAPRLTEQRAMELMIFHHKKRKALKKLWLTSKRTPFTSVFFGWDIRYFPLGRYWHLKFSKLFKNVTAQEVSQRAWDNAQRLVSYRTRLPYQRMVQRINENAFVIARWTGERDRNMKSNQVIYLLRFRVEEPDGTIGIGMQTLPEPGEDEAAVEETLFSGSEDVCLYIKLKPVKKQDSGEEHCMAEFSGRTQFGDTDYAQLNALEFVISLARWEEVNVLSPPLQLQW